MFAFCLILLDPGFLFLSPLTYFCRPVPSRWPLLFFFHPTLGSAHTFCNVLLTWFWFFSVCRPLASNLVLVLLPLPRHVCMILVSVS